jgi:predicted PurR-regulated permease PerM
MTPPPVEPEETSEGFTVTPVGLVLVLLVAYLLLRAEIIVILVLLAILFATIIERPVRSIERRGIPRAIAILAVYVALAAGFGLLVILVAPAVATAGHLFVAQAPDELRQLAASWRASGHALLSGPGQRLLERGSNAIAHPPAVPRTMAINAASRLAEAVVGAIALFVLAFYYLLEKDLIRRLILDTLPSATRPRAARVWGEIEAKVGAWLRGQVIVGLVVGSAALVTYRLLGLRFWLVLGLMAGLLELIPILGPWVAGTAAAVLALTQSWQQAVLVVVFILLRQFAVDAFLIPRIMKGAVGLPPLTVFLAVLTGTRLLGPPGALLAIPVAAAIQVVLTDALAARRPVNEPGGRSPSSWRWLWSAAPDDSAGTADGLPNSPDSQS